MTINIKRLNLLKKLKDIMDSGTTPLENPKDVTTSIRWKCRCGEETNSSLHLKWTQLQKRGYTTCTKCDNYTQRAQTRVNTLTANQVVDRLKLGEFELVGEYLGSTITKHNIRCTRCNNISFTTPQAKFQSMDKGQRGCKSCNEVEQNQRLNPGRNQVLKRIDELGLDVLTEDYIGEYVYKGGQKITVHNRHTKETFEVTPTNLLSRGVVSPEHGKRVRIQQLHEHNKQLYELWAEQRPEQIKYQTAVRKLTEITYRANKAQINPFNYERVLAGANSYNGMQLDHIIPIAWGWDKKIPIEMLASVDNLRMLEWRDNQEKGTNMPPYVPITFRSYFTYDDRINIATSWIQANIPGLTDDVNIPYANDLQFVGYHDKSKVAIYIMMNDVVPITKYKLAETIRIEVSEVGITPIIIFEDELIDEFLLRRKLLHLTHQADVQTIYARRTTVITPSQTDVNKFLSRYHLQGSVQYQTALGLEYEGVLVAVMTFTKPRAALGRIDTNDGEWELSRYATDSHYHVVGGASKLLEAFKRNVSWTKIFSYADKRWSVGRMYDTLGFKQTANNPPQYFYNVGDGRRQHRWMFRKDILKTKFAHVYDETLTEEQILENAGLYRIWDCGTLTYELCNY